MSNPSHKTQLSLMMPRHFWGFLCVVTLASLSAGDAHGYKRSMTEDGDLVDWNCSRIPFFVHERGSDDVAIEVVSDTIQKSFLTWQAVECSALEFFFAGYTSDEEVGYRPGEANVNSVVFRETEASWRHPRDVVALTTVTFCRAVGGACRYVGQIIDADIELNGAHLGFSTSDPAPLNRFDLENSITHEVGHFIGFDHSSDSNATMFASAPPGETDKRDLADDDENAICDTYPVSDPLATCAVPSTTGAGGGNGYDTTVETEPGGCQCEVAGSDRGDPILPLVMLMAVAAARLRIDRYSSR